MTLAGQHLYGVPSDALMRQSTLSALVQAMIYRQFETKSLPEPMLSFGPQGINSSEIWSKIRKFSLKKVHLKIASAKCPPFCRGTMDYCSPRWRHSETFSALLALCEGNPPVTGGFPSQKVSNTVVDVFSGVSLNKRLNKQSSVGDLRCHGGRCDVTLTHVRHPFQTYSETSQILAQRDQVEGLISLCKLAADSIVLPDSAANDSHAKL